MHGRRQGGSFGAGGEGCLGREDGHDRGERTFIASRADAGVIEEKLVPWLRGKQRWRWKGGDTIKPDKVAWRGKHEERWWR